MLVFCVASRYIRRDWLQESSGSSLGRERSSLSQTAMAPAMSLFQPCRILLFFYDNLTNGDKASIWLRERHVRQADGSTLLVREANWRGDGPWHGWWRFSGFADGPFHELTIAFNRLFPHRPRLHPVHLLRQNGTQWTGADYAPRRVVMTTPSSCQPMAFGSQRGKPWLWASLSWSTTPCPKTGRTRGLPYNDVMLHGRTATTTRTRSRTAAHPMKTSGKTCYIRGVRAPLARAHLARAHPRMLPPRSSCTSCQGREGKWSSDRLP